MATNSLDHLRNCLEEFRRTEGGDTTDTGFSERSEEFKRRYQLKIDFDDECLGCCVGYLLSRGYENVDAKDRRTRMIYFSDGKSHDPKEGPRNLISSFARAPEGGGKKGQIETMMDINLGKPTARCIQNSRTYQLYSPTGVTGGLSIGFNAKARLESVAIDVVKPYELLNIYLNYADAVLIEKYREKENLPSLSSVEVTGYCVLDEFRRKEVEQKKDSK